MPLTNQKPFPSDTAGSKMTSDIPVVESQMPIGEVLVEIQKEIRKFEAINYIYIVNRERKLVGVFSLKEIFKAPKTKKIEELMKKDLVTIKPLTDQEKVAYLALKHNLKAIPVVDHQNRLLGIVPSETLLKIFHKETGEDILLSSGIHAQAARLLTANVTQVARLRLPWIFIGLLGGMVAANIIGVFESALEAFIVLVSFIPVMMHTGGNVGNQSAMIFIRSLLIGNNLGNNHGIRNYFLREVKIGLVIGLVCAILLSLFSLLWQGPIMLGVIVGLSMFIIIVVAAMVGLLVPWSLHKFNLDPALGTGPFITTLQDVIGLLVYFSIASAMMRYFL